MNPEVQRRRKVQLYFLAVLCPPLAARKACETWEDKNVFFTLVLTLLGFVPGILFASYLVYQYLEEQAQIRKALQNVALQLRQMENQLSSRDDLNNASNPLPATSTGGSANPSPSHRETSGQQSYLPFRMPENSEEQPRRPPNSRRTGTDSRYQPPPLPNIDDTQAPPEGISPAKIPEPTSGTANDAEQGSAETNSPPLNEQKAPSLTEDELATPHTLQEFLLEDYKRNEGGLASTDSRTQPQKDLPLLPSERNVTGESTISGPSSHQGLETPTSIATNQAVRKYPLYDNPYTETTTPASYESREAEADDEASSKDKQDQPQGQGPNTLYGLEVRGEDSRRAKSDSRLLPNLSDHGGGMQDPPWYLDGD
ncbi:hypothetical protein CI109_104022 [Kwoniella shandongensis]|uniref:Uncharacterized protein n=1 Tax=Kwoniella shandongensis TaxID=1734106 RepID=A0A5M6BXJ6_9TREE|nr:uncharacterized protein CI109_004093 [Kwoniella shandongensis]KAA5527554.1 hypothetical protein CI109_004093 [Kwoniella shandongensis]